MRLKGWSGLGCREEGLGVTAVTTKGRSGGKGREKRGIWEDLEDVVAAVDREEKGQGHRWERRRRRQLKGRRRAWRSSSSLTAAGPLDEETADETASTARSEQTAM